MSDLRNYFIGCGACGATAGFLIGGSNSPVVQYVVPVLFALIGGGAAFLAAVESLSGEDGIKKLNVIGTAAAFVSVPLLLFSVYASLLRTDRGVSVLVPDFYSIGYPIDLKSTQFTDLSISELSELVILQHELDGLGVPRDMQQHLLIGLSTDWLMHKASYISKREEILDSLLRIISAIEENEEDTSLLDNSDFVTIYLNVESALSAVRQAGDSTTIPDVQHVRTVQRSLTDFSSMFQETKDEFHQNDLLRGAIEKFTELTADLPAENLVNAALQGKIDSALQRAAGGDPRLRANQGYAPFAHIPRDAISPHS